MLACKGADALERGLTDIAQKGTLKLSSPFCARVAFASLITVFIWRCSHQPKFFLSAGVSARYRCAPERALFSAGGEDHDAIVSEAVD